MQALKALPKDKKPEKLVIMMTSGAIGHWNVPFPEGSAPTPQQIFEEESGIKLEIVGVGDNDQFTKIIQDTTTKAGGYDILLVLGPDKGSLSEAGALLELDDYVAQVQARVGKVLHRRRGHGAAATTTMPASACWSTSTATTRPGPTAPTCSRTPKEQKDFKAKYGWDLQWPETWEQFDQVAQFFTRPDKNLVGCTDLRNPIWGQVQLYQRFCCMREPNSDVTSTRRPPSR